MLRKKRSCFWAFKHPRKHMRISSIEEEVSALTKIPNSTIFMMKSVPLGKSAEYAQSQIAAGGEGVTLLPPLVLTNTGLQDRKQMFSFENLKDSCGQATLKEFFMDPEEGSLPSACSCVTLDEYLEYTQSLKSLSSPSPRPSSVLSSSSSSSLEMSGNAGGGMANEMAVDSNFAAAAAVATTTGDQVDELTNRTLYAKNVLCLSSWKAAINECFANTPFAFNSSSNLFNALPIEKQIPTNNITLDIGVPGTGFSPSFDLGYRVCACLQQEDNGCGLWICVQPSDIDKALLCDTLMSITPDDPLVFRKLSALASAATFPIYVGVAREGEAVVLPPGSVFANINFGGRFSRAVWDVFTPRSVEYALLELSPLCRAIGAAEVFEMKAMAYYGLLRTWEHLQKGASAANKDALLRDAAALIRALELEVRENTAGAAVQPAQHAEMNALKKVCQRCGCNLFSRGYQCAKCAVEPLDGFVCIECAAEGRSCGHPSHDVRDLVLMEFFPLVECTNILDLAVVAYKSVNR